MLNFLELIPYGWGHEDGMNIDDDVDRATLKDDDVYAGNLHQILVMEKDSEDNASIDEENPHLTMASAREELDDFDDESIPKEIFDESLRYSDINRPKLSVNKSSPLPQRRGSFSDPNEKIANLFGQRLGTS